MKKILLACLSFIIISGCLAQSAIQSTEYFEFYNNYWINLHHFLYQKAKGSQLKKLEEDGMGFRKIGEDTVVLSRSENDVLDRAIYYYQKNLIDKDLRRDLGAIRRWLQQQAEPEEIRDTTFSAAYTDLLNEVSTVYKRHFWKLHKELNLNVLNHHIEVLRALELEVIGKIEKLAKYKWPDVAKVRVDLTVYANYAGAYTATDPSMNIVISTIDPLNNTSSLIETVYHEGSHLLFNYQDSPFRGEIYYQAQEMKMEFPRNLWHACLFYLCGRATQDALKSLSIDHKMDMDVRNIFAGYNTQKFRNTLEDYYQGMIDLKNTVSALLADLDSGD